MLNLKFLLDNEEREVSKNIKEIYKLFFDKKVLLWEEELISSEDFLKIKLLEKKRRRGEDITFDIGYRYFRGNKIKLKKGVFVPQFDTEQIIDIVLDKGIKSGKALEVGSGTGVISIALAIETKMKVDSIDINKEAIELSNINKKNIDVNYINEDFFKYKTNKKYDLLISNPPYIKKGDYFIEEWVKENQPNNSLYAKEQGLSFYISFFNRAKELLNIGAYIIIEIGFEQANDVCLLANEISESVEVIKDYNNLDRFVVFRYEK